MKKCPYCAEEVQDTAAKCKHCGEWLQNKPSPLGKNVSCLQSIVIIGISTLVIGSCIMTIDNMPSSDSPDYHPTGNPTWMYDTESKPMQSAWDGSVPLVKQYIEDRVADPSALEFHEWFKLVKPEGDYEGDPDWIVRVDYSGTNAFGGRVRKQEIAFIKNGEVIRMVGTR